MEDMVAKINTGENKTIFNKLTELMKSHGLGDNIDHTKIIEEAFKQTINQTLHKTVQDFDTQNLTGPQQQQNLVKNLAENFHTNLPAGLAQNLVKNAQSLAKRSESGLVHDLSKNYGGHPNCCHPAHVENFNRSDLSDDTHLATQEYFAKYLDKDISGD